MSRRSHKASRASVSRRALVLGGRISAPKVLRSISTRDFRGVSGMGSPHLSRDQTHDVEFSAPCIERLGRAWSGARCWLPRGETGVSGWPLVDSSVLAETHEERRGRACCRGIRSRGHCREKRRSLMLLLASPALLRSCMNGDTLVRSSICKQLHELHSHTHPVLFRIRIGYLYA